MDDLENDTLQTIAPAHPDLDAIARSRLLLLDSLKEGIYRIDEDGLCVFMNRAAGEMLGYGLGEARGCPMHELHHPRPECSGSDASRRSAAGQELGHLNRRDMFRRRDGMCFPVEWSLHPLLESGVYRGAVITFSDITARLKGERRLRLQSDVNSILGSAVSVEEAAPGILKSICETLDLDGAWFWEIGRTPGSPGLLGQWHRWGSEFSALEPNSDLAGRIGRSGTPLWILGPGEACGSVFAIPLSLGSRVLGVMHFATSEARPEDPDILQTMLLLGSGIAQFMERRRAEQAQGRLIAILETVSDFVGVAIDPEGKILSVNNAVRRIFGYLPGELLEKSLDLVIPEYRLRLRESGWMDGKAERCGAGERTRRIRTRGIHKSGRTVPLELSLGECVEHGRRVLTFIIADTSERDAADEALRNQTRLVQLIVSSMGDGVIVADENLNLLVVNPAAQRLIPPVRGIKSLLEAQQTLNGPDSVVFCPDGVTRYGWNDLPIVRAIRGESVDNSEILLRPPGCLEGTWLSETARPLIDDTGTLRGGVIISRDITGQKASAEALRKAKEEAETANRAKSEFLSRMSHELRTPMNAILGFAQLLELDELTEEQMFGVTRILRAGRHLLSLINEILDLTRIEAGRLTVAMERVDPRELMQAALDLVHPLMEQRNIRLVELLEHDDRHHVHANPQRLTQVFLNLLSNAVKYNRDGGSVEISYSCHASRDPGQLRISITDSGAGIAPADLKKLFVPFERLAADQTAIEGTGLGLALSEHLLRLMKGKIGVKSTVGEGSTFWVDVMLCDEKAQPTTAEVGFRDSRDDAAYPNNVLYIENDLGDVGSVERMLCRIPGLQVISAGEGRLGLQMALDHRPELILLSAALPDLTALEVVRQLRRQEETRLIPVVIVSEETSEHTRNEWVQAGARTSITKPAKARELLDVVTGIISHEALA
jgi:PAS domain S-box-containing protein